MVNTSEQIKPLPSEVCAEVLKLLRSKGHLALREVERLMGWESPIGMTNHIMAQRLGITENQLKYLLHRHYLSKKEKAQRLAERDVKNIAFATHTSRMLGFSISLPADWRVITDTCEWSRLAHEYLELVLRSERPEKPTRAWFRNGAAVTNPQELQRLAEEEFDERKADAKRHARLEQMATGLFQAEPPASEDAPFVEVTKLRLDGPLTALELYKLDKHLPEMVPWGSRPTKGMIVDGLPGVVYYFIMDAGEATQKQPVFFNVYLAHSDEGWILSCQCRYGDFFFKTFTRYKPVFRRIIGSFQRLRTA